MDHERRDFLRTTTGIMGAFALGGVLSGCAAEEESESADGQAMAADIPWSYAMCNESMQEKSWAEQCQVIGNAGYTGVEIASFTLVEKGVQELSQSQRQQMVADMEEAGIECVGLHWLLAPPPEGLHFTHPNASRRKEAVAYLDELIDFCGDLGGEVMIFGSPDQRGTTGGLSVAEATNNFADGLAQVADHAQERGVTILVEPLGSEQTDVVNTMAEAMDVVRKIDHPAISTMFDFHNTPDETEPFPVLIEKYFDHLEHVHVQEMDGTYLGTGNAVEEFVPAFQTLKDLGYDKWVSLEVFDFTPGGETIANESMATLREIESQLT